jgi:hypothetical protein
MNLYNKLVNRPYIFLRITGISTGKFNDIIKKLQPIWYKKHLNKKILDGRPYGVGSLENQLLCLLIYYRTYTTQLFIGFWFRVDDATVCRTIKRLEPFLFQVVKIEKEPKLSEDTLRTLLLDATEQRTQGTNDFDCPYYSGKKKCHTIKTEIIMTKKGKIIQISQPFPGSVHDITVRRESDPIPESKSIYADSGYQGLANDYSNIKLPKKKLRGKPLSEEEKKYNKSVHYVRNPVEFKFRELKIFQILYQTYRNSKLSYAIKMLIIAGIVNLKNGF